jgi:hypothetical protein
MATTATPAKKSTAKKAAAAPKPKAERKPKTQSPCQCFSTPSGNTTDEGEPIYRSCGLTTTGRFAPGHDAKLKSVLMNLAVAGQEYHRHDGGMLVSGDPAAMARDLAWSHFVDKAIERNAANNERRATRAAEQAAAKAEREAAKTKRAAEKEAARAEVKAAQERIAASKGQGTPARAKIGRQVYDVEIVSEDVNQLTVRYQTRSGNATTAVIKRSQVVTD